MIIHPNQRRQRSASPWTRSSVLPAFNTIAHVPEAEYRPSRRRLRRATEQWLPIGHANVLARITVLQHGGHTRPVLHRGSKHSRFRFVATTSGTTQLGEGKGEEFLAQYNDVATPVVDFICHPWEIEMIREGQSETYRPDAVRMFWNGHVEVIEVKRTPDDLADPQYRRKLALVKEVLRRCGMEFRVLYLHDILGPWERRMNVSALFCRRTMLLTKHEERIAKRLVANGQPVEWGHLRDRLAPADSLRGDAAIERLLARGLLATDLDIAFRPGTILQPTPPFTGPSEIRL